MLSSEVTAHLFPPPLLIHENGNLFSHAPGRYVNRKKIQSDNRPKPNNNNKFDISMVRASPQTKKCSISN